MHALSVKQPWATLLAHGLKTIEIRRWSTKRRGRVLIHAARVPDERAEAWERVPTSLHNDALLVGGFVGAANLVVSKRYASVESFRADSDRHFCPEAWFDDAAATHGFVFEEARVVPYHAHSGWMRFFPVPDDVVRLLGLSQSDD